MKSPSRSAPFSLSSLAVTATLVLAFALAMLSPASAHALDRTFAASAQLDYHFVPTARGANARANAFDGFTLEAAAKITVDVTDSFSGTIKLCVGCHGLETDMAHLEYRVADELAFRVGRFSPQFGGFNNRHDPANHRLSDKPLPYDMGRMLRLRGWNMGVLPSPFPDNGAEVTGALHLSPTATLDYAAHAVSGFKGERNGLDLDFVQSRDGNLYYVDNNGRPSFGGRVALTLSLAERSELTAGASLMRGTFDPTNDLAYTIFGGDLSLRLDKTNVRLEYLARRQDIDVSDPTRFQYVVLPNGDFTMKHGALAEVEQPVTSFLDVIARADGMLRIGNVAVVRPGEPPSPDGQLARSSWVLRGTLGTAITLERGLRLKASGEVWKFSDDDASGKQVAVSMHLGLVGSF